MASLHRLFYNASQGSEAAQKWIKDVDLFTLKLSPEDREWAIKMQAEIQNPTAKTAKVAQFATDAQIFENPRFKLGIPQGAKGDARWGPVQDQYLQAVRAYTQTNNAEPNAEQKAAIMDRLTTTFVRSTWFGASSEEIPVVNAKPSDVEALPEGIRTRLLETFKRAGNPDPTPTQVLLLYRQYQDAQGAK